MKTEKLKCITDKNKKIKNIISRKRGQISNKEAETTFLGTEDNFR